MIFKRDKKYLLYTISVSHLLMFFIGIGGNLTRTNFLPIWVIFVVLPNFILFILKNLSSIEVREKDIVLIFSKYFKTYIESYDHTDLKFTYKKEFEANSRGMRFKIFKKEDVKSIVNIGGLADGWPDNEIEKIIIELEKRGIIVLADSN